jgi:hypothetical protein
MPHPKNGYSIAGACVPGVTTIIGRFKDSAGLLHWAFEQGKAAQRGEINSLYDRRNQSADAGTLAHAMVEAHLAGEWYDPPSDIDPDILAKGQQGFQNFLTWKENTRITITHQEVQLTSSEYQFGGCIDAVGADSSKKVVLIDWKTSNAIYQDALLQLAAYSILWDENFPNSKVSGGYHLCRFSKETADFHHHYWNELEDAKEQFILLRRCYELDKKLKRRV